MPTYEYECKKCGHQFEVLQSIKADSLKTCPKAQCPQDSGRGKVMRLIGTGGGTCWSHSETYGYRLDVTATVTGNGTYTVADFDASGDSNPLTFDPAGGTVPTLLNLTIDITSGDASASIVFNDATPDNVDAGLGQGEVGLTINITNIRN